MFSVGIDAHNRSYAMCILDDHGKVFKQHTLSGSVPEVAAWLGKLKQPFRVCYEASLGYGLLFDALKPIAKDVQVAHPAHVRSIFNSKKKNDRIDARKLAKCLYMDEVPRVHVPTLDVREWRVLIEHRRRLVDKRTATKNGLRALLRSQGIQSPKGKRMWASAGITWTKTCEFKSSLTALRRDQLLLELEHFDRAIELAEKTLDQIGEQHPGVTLLRTIPGVGPRTAEAVVAYVDDPHRFSSTRKAASYFGLVPSLDESGGTSRYGHITKEGPATVRKLLVESSWRVMSCSPTMREYFLRIKNEQKDRAGKAIVATARYMVQVMVAMLKSGEEWRERITPKAEEERHHPGKDMK